MIESGTDIKCCWETVLVKLKFLVDGKINVDGVIQKITSQQKFKNFLTDLNGEIFNFIRKICDMIYKQSLKGISKNLRLHQKSWEMIVHLLHRIKLCQELIKFKALENLMYKIYDRKLANKKF